MQHVLIIGYIQIIYYINLNLNNVVLNTNYHTLFTHLTSRARRYSRVFLKMVHDVIFSNSRFMDVFLHPKSMECILLVSYDGYHYI